MEEINIREMHIDDIPMAAIIEQECFSAPWSIASLEDSFLRDEFVFYTAEVKNNNKTDIIGYSSAYYSFDEGNIVNVAVTGRARNSGAGTKLIAALEEVGIKRNAQFMFLEVRVSNQKAISLYEKLGYKKLGIRKKFYEKPAEDGYIYKKDLRFTGSDEKPAIV